MAPTAQWAKSGVFVQWVYYQIYPRSLATFLTHYHLSILQDQDHSFCKKYFFAPENIFEKFEKIFNNIPIGQKPLIWPTVQWSASA